jgi:uncharacterized coiled-coil protein SlyX
LAEIESTIKNLSTALTEINIKIEKTIKRVSILIRQLKKISLSLIIVREKEAVIILKIGYTIYRLVTLKV